MFKTRILKFAAVLCLQAIAMGQAFAAFPERDIKIIIPFSPGGGFDSYVRALTPYIEKHLPNKVNVLPINTPGAGGRRGATETYRAKPDGYTIGVFNMPGALIPQLQDGPKVGYDLEKLTWLATLGDDPYAYVVKGGSPITSFDMIKAQKEPVLYGATGPSSTSYIATTILNKMLNIPNEVVTGYTGSSEYTVGVIRGDVTAALVSMSTARPYIKSGDVRMLAVIGADSTDPAVADAESLGEPELAQLNVVRMIGAPPGLPTDVKATLEKAILAALDDPDFKKWLEATGNEVNPAGAAGTAESLVGMMNFYKNFTQMLGKE